MPYDPAQLQRVLDESTTAKDHVFKAQNAVAELAPGAFQRSLRHELGKIRGELEAMDRALRHAIEDITEEEGDRP